ncbi:hypothetical protein [Sorangium sp. So ce388]|uniref:hypothetical protein n=1 Tax=Sorangium sp. So ce388 TaxID=3133309 RepID=UPI003F5C9BEA
MTIKALALSSVLVLGDLFALAPASASPAPSGDDVVNANPAAAPDYLVRMRRRAREYRMNRPQNERRIKKIKSVRARSAAKAFHGAMLRLADVDPGSSAAKKAAKEVGKSAKVFIESAESDTADFKPSCLRECVSIYKECSTDSLPGSLCDMVGSACIMGCVPDGPEPSDGI